VSASNLPKSGLAQALRVADLGFRLVVACLVGSFAGYWLDRILGLLEWFPLLTLVGFFLGLAAGMVALVRGISAAERPPPAEAGPPPPEAGPEDRETDRDGDG